MFANSAIFQGPLTGCAKICVRCAQAPVHSNGQQQPMQPWHMLDARQELVFPTRGHIEELDVKHLVPCRCCLSETGYGAMHSSIPLFCKERARMALHGQCLCIMSACRCA